MQVFFIHTKTGSQFTRIRLACEAVPLLEMSTYDCKFCSFLSQHLHSAYQSKMVHKPSKIPTPAPQNSGFGLTEAEIEAQADAFFYALVHKATYAPGDHGIPHKDIPIGKSEAELARFRAGRKFFKRNLFQATLAFALAEFSMAPVARITNFILPPNVHKDARYMMIRNLSSYVHVCRWFESELEDSVSKTDRNFEILRFLK
jgi:hypothetical protein